MNDLTKLAASCNRSNEKLKFIKAAILHEHYRSLGLLVCMYKLMKLIKAIRTANLKSNYLACLHRLDSYLNVVLPRASYVYCINVIKLKNIVIILCAEDLGSVLLLGILDLPAGNNKSTKLREVAKINKMIH